MGDGDLGVRRGDASSSACVALWSWFLDTGVGRGGANAALDDRGRLPGRYWGMCGGVLALAVGVLFAAVGTRQDWLDALDDGVLEVFNNGAGAADRRAVLKEARIFLVLIF